MDKPKLMYESRGITLYCGDCRHLLPDVPNGIALITDPPYGITLDCANKARGRGVGGTLSIKNKAIPRANDYADVVGDDKQFDPAHILRFRTITLFGANHFASRLPDVPGWICWDKVAELRSDREFGFNDNADCELIWTNSGKPARIIRHKWMGAIKGSEKFENRFHPTQKPVELMVMLIKMLTGPDDVIVDPYMGSGSTAVAALRLGRKFIGCEIVEEYVRTSIWRIKNEDGAGVMMQMKQKLKRMGR